MLRIKAETYSRVSGYYRPVNQWNKGKQEEFKERKFISKEGINEVQNIFTGVDESINNPSTYTNLESIDMVHGV